MPRVLPLNPDILPDRLYTAETVREIDRTAIQDYGIPGITLMRRAAAACVDAMTSWWPESHRVLVLCGGGNNAGDGYIIAGMLRERHYDVAVRFVGDTGKYSQDAQTARQYCIASGIDPLPFDVSAVPPADVIVDALLGTGLNGDIRPDFAAAISAVNAAGARVLAVDIPSGLCANTGNKLGDCVMADITMTFIGLKQGMFTLNGPDACGQLLFDSLGVPDGILEQAGHQVRKLNQADPQYLPGKRPRNSHKNQFGHVLVIGGDVGMGGAVMLAAEAAMRCGAGLVSVATHPDHVVALLARRPEIMARGIKSTSELDALLRKASVLVLGPGLGHSEWSQMVYDHVMEKCELPLVIDADALGLLAAKPVKRANRILTPHPGEALTLLKACSDDPETVDIAADRFAAVKQLQHCYGGVSILKGAGTLIADEQGVTLCPYGNPGMSVAGMGDVLSGVIGALLAQGLPLTLAAQQGVMCHALAGDQAAKDGERGLMATDLLPHLRQLLNRE
ncbi:MAG: NAD(P)H-hydrate dehydratase [Pseudomonadales bacterium]|nr:NAD(P)H-hydrate dehydratase [Pseudomonadales bacterium]